MLDGEPTLKDRVIAFFKGAPKRYSFASEMDPAAKRWLREYKKLFDEVSRLNAGMNAAENLNSEFEIRNSELDGTATKAPEKVIRKIGKLVDDTDNSPKKIIKLGKIVENAQKTPLTNINEENMSVSGERSAIKNNIQENFFEDKYYQRQIDKIDELKQGGYITVGEIPSGSPLNKIGFPNAVVYFDVSKIVKEMRTRSDVVPSQTMKAIPQVLNNPIVITEYVDNAGMHSANVYGHLFIGNSPVVVGVMMTQTQKGNIISKIKTVHPNRDVLKEMTDDKILYLSENKKETKLWFQSLGKQTLPLGGNKFGFIRSISQNSQNSNAFDKKSAKKFNSDGRNALSDGKKATSSDVARVKSAISEMNIDPRGIMTVADSYFGRYDGSLSRTALRFEFLEAAQIMLGSEKDAYDRAYARIEAIADELIYNEKDVSGFSDDLKEIKRHIREITFAVKNQDKGEFDSFGGFGEFRKRYFGKLKIANEGASVDEVYGELQTLYGLALFPDLNTAQEMLIRIAEVVDMDPSAQVNGDIDLNAVSSDLAVEITHRLVGAFDNKLMKKTSRMSKAEAEAYKARINAKTEMKAAKAIAKAKAKFENETAKIKSKADKKVADAKSRAEMTVETEKAKLHAEYETDAVFNQTKVNKALGNVPAFAALPSKVRSELSRNVWLEMNESDGSEWRRVVEIKHTVKICDEIMRNPDSGYDPTNVLERRRLNDEIY